MSFPTVSVAELLKSGEAEVKTGPFGTQLKASDYVPEGTPVINVRNIGFGNIREEKLEYIGEETVRRLSSHLLRSEDIVFGRKGAVERHVFIQPNQSNWFQGSDCLRLRLSSSRILPRFASYYLLTHEHQQWMMGQCSHGATMASLNQDIISRIQLPCPPIETQRRIASILSAYDDLIENNTRRIAILEEMARRIYEEWFVHSRFPGHEQVKMVESELGLIPEGWSVTGLFNLATVKYGKNLATKHLVEDGAYPVYGAAKVIGRYDSYTREQRTIIAGCRGSVGEFQITEPKCFVTNNSFTFDPVQDDDFFWLYFCLRNRGLRDVVGGAAQPQITLEGIESVNLMTPDLGLRQQFRNVVEGMMQMSWVLAQKNTNLRATRDLLLPKLISGELDVPPLPEPEEAIAA